MEVKVPTGKYVLAVSGGVDSMVLLDLLARLDGVELVVAHFDHGIRPDSGFDEALVRQTANKHGLLYEAGRAGLGLGPDASEEMARGARYGFLQAVVRKHAAAKIIMAHHQDDWIETTLINIIRGTGRQGVSAMLNNPKILRPLIDIPKIELVRHAITEKLHWNEDNTNQDQDYLRNYLRLSILTKLSAVQRRDLLKNLDKVAKTNIELDNELATLSHKSPKTLNRQEFSALPSDVGRELIAFLLRQLGVKDYDRGTVNRLSLAIKTARPDSFHPIKDKAYLDLKTESATIVTP